MVNTIKICISYLVLVVVSLNSNVLLAQCATSVSPCAVGSCSGGSGTATNGQNIFGGQTYWYSGAATNFSSGLNIYGGTLRVCGTLTLSSIAFQNNSSIIVESGGNLTVNVGFNMDGGCTICNRGTLTIKGDVTMQNSNNYIFNTTSASVLNINQTTSTQLNMTGTTNYFINNGIANIGRLMMQMNSTPNAICLGSGSSLNVSTLVNNNSNSTINVGGAACVSIASQAQLNNPFSSSSNVLVCMLSGSTVAYGSWGSPTVSNPCTNCFGLLPVKLVYFKIVDKMNDEITLGWQTATEIDNHYFEIQHSIDGLNWDVIGQLPGEKKSTQLKNYTFSHANPYLGINYYRLKQVDYSGYFTFTNTIDVDALEDFKANFLIYPNPIVNNNLSIRTLLKKDYNIVVFNSLGVNVFEQEYSKEISQIEIPLTNLPKGIYSVSFYQENQLLESKRIIFN